MNFLFVSDLHIRKNNPKNYIDDFQKIQIDTLKYISQIAKEKKAIIIIAGDIFHNSNDDYVDFIIELMGEIFKQSKVYFIAGNHDLLYKQIKNFEQSNISRLLKFDNWNFVKTFENNEIIINFYNYGEKVKKVKSDKKKICVMHRCCVKEEKLPFYLPHGITAKQLIDAYNYDVFVVGDNHNSFVYHIDNRYVFNPGCCTRQNLNEEKYTPQIFLYYLNTNKYEFLLLPDNKKNIFKKESLVLKIEKENNFDSLIELLDTNANSVSFEDNLNKYLEKNKINNDIKNKIYDLLDNGGVL